VLHRWRAGGTPCPLNPKSLTVSHAELGRVFFLFQTSGNATVVRERERVQREQSGRTSSLALRLASCSTAAIFLP
jgi:hypothetical protein